jgi:hypothetical protein
VSGGTDFLHPHGVADPGEGAEFAAALLLLRHVQVRFSTAVGEFSPTK